MSPIVTVDINIGRPSDGGMAEAFQKLGEAMSKAAFASTEAMNAFVFQLAQDERVQKLISQLIKELGNTITAHYRDYAEPNEVVDYIIDQPNHTWMGVTIYPDEAWRYQSKSDWMWWRR